MMIRWLRPAGVALGACLMLLGAAPLAASHEERDVEHPDGTGSVPEYRTPEEAAEVLLVCGTEPDEFEQRITEFPAAVRDTNQDLYDQCRADGYRSLQEAVDAVSRPETNIYILPGEYREEPARSEPAGDCADLDAPWAGNGEYQVLSFEQQEQCPHNQNLVAVLGIHDLQIEGTGATPEDVVLDAGYERLNALRADRADGIYLRNFTAQRTTFNAVYIMETQGFVIDDVVGRWNDEYGFLTFAVDHGLYTGCEAYGNGDSGIYPGAASDINADRDHDVDRYAVEITGCHSHHNLLGYSGTAGDSVWAHGNVFSDNSAGAAMDSLFPDHPGMPQNHARFENNVIHGNNHDYYGHVRDGTCARPSAERGYEQGVVCPAVGIPPGTGILVAGGNYNVFVENWVYGHDYTGFLLLHVPGFARGENGWAEQTDTSHHNAYIDNALGVTPDGAARPNRLDVWWDGQGTDNCWQADVGTSHPPTLPACGDEPGELSGSSTSRWFAEPATLASLYVCGEYSLQDQHIPSGCVWLGASGVERLDVQLALAGSALLGVAGVLLWWRRLRWSGLATWATAIGMGGLVLGVIAVPYGHTMLPAAALVLTGGWLVAIATVLGNTPFGWLTGVLGAVTLVHALDKAVLMLPWIPLSPGWLRLVLGAVWVVWAIVKIVAAPPPVPASPARA